MNRDDIPSCHRAYRNRFWQWLGRTIVKLMGWRIDGGIPDVRKIIIAVAPHTSNWDFVVGLATLLALDLNIHWIGKHTIFRPPFRRLLISLGGVPVDRCNPKGVVEQVADRVRRADSMVVGIMPEGTRGKVERWKTGFLRIARAAQCDVLLAALDYGDKRVVMGDVIKPGVDVDQQTQQIRQYYRQYRGHRPELF